MLDHALSRNTESYLLEAVCHQNTIFYFNYFSKRNSRFSEFKQNIIAEALCINSKILPKKSLFGDHIQILVLLPQYTCEVTTDLCAVTTIYTRGDHRILVRWPKIPCAVSNITDPCLYEEWFQFHNNPTLLFLSVSC